MAHYRLDPIADVDGTHLLVEVDLVPAHLVRRFGPPHPADGFKVSGEYTFVDDAGAPTPEEFWARRTEEEFSIGGHHGPAAEFVAWLRAQLAGASDKDLA